MTNNWPAPDPSNIGSQVLPGDTLETILQRSDFLNPDAVVIDPPISAEISAWLSDFTAHSPKGVKLASEIVRDGR